MNNIQKLKKILSSILPLAVALGVMTPVAAGAANLTFTYGGSVSISSGSTVGNTLTSSVGSWSPSATSLSYQWYRGSTPIEGATSSSYVTQGDDYLSTIYLQVTGNRAGYDSLTSTSYGTTVYYKGTFDSALKPTITGDPQVGETLTANTSGWPKNTVFTYQWYSAGWYTIYGATSKTYQLKSSEKGDTITVRVTPSHPGYYSSSSVASDATVSVKPSLPKIVVSDIQGTLTGKNILTAKGTQAFDSYATIDKWCFAVDGYAVNLPASTKGGYFYDNLGSRLNVQKLSNGCFRSTDGSNLTDARLRFDVTSWSVGTHTISVTATDTAGYTSNTSSTVVAVAKTAPTVTTTVSGSSVSDTMSVTASTTTHSSTAPIRSWCLTLDGKPIKSFVSAGFKNASGSAENATEKPASLGVGCFQNTSGDLAQAEFKINSMLFENGAHTLGVTVQSGDGESIWASERSTSNFNIKNKFIPVIKWSEATKAPTMKSQTSSISGTITANIPGNPSSIVISTLDAAGTPTVIGTITNSRTFSVKKKFSENTQYKIEIFDEDKVSALSETRDLKISPFVKMAKPRVTITGSTISDKTTKTVYVSVTSAAGQKPECTAKWSGGSKTFTVKGTKKTTISFRPYGSGTVSVVCGAEGLADSKALTGKY